MKIGFTCQGMNDDAFLEGLKERLCPGATLIRGAARGSLDKNIRRDIEKHLLALEARGAEIFIVLNDSDKGDFRKIRRSEIKHIPNEFKEDSVYGIAERNIECWLTADTNYCREKFGVKPSKGLGNRKKYFEDAMGISARSPKKEETVVFVTGAPIKSWYKNSKSFKSFYDDLKNMAVRKNCARFINAAHETT